jgi:hypothetical protein
VFGGISTPRARISRRVETIELMSVEKEYTT